MKKFKRIILVIVLTGVILIAVVIIFISPITKYLIEKYDEKVTGRQITLDWAYVNPFTGYIHLKNLKIYEYRSDSLFLSADGLSVHFAILKYFNHTFEIKSAALDHPVVKVILDKKRLNFQDVIDKFSSGKDSSKKSTPYHVNLLHLKITNAEFHYTDKQIPFNYFIKNGNFETVGKHWDEDTMAIRYSFLSGPFKGSLDGDFHVNFKTSDYLFSVRVKELDLKPLEQYVKDLANYGNIQASLDASLLAKGNFHDAQNITAKGHVAFNNFHLGKNPADDYMAFDHLKLVVTELSPINNKYLFDSISLIHPFVKYEQYDHTDNLQTMFVKKGKGGQGENSNMEKLNIIVMIGKYIKKLSINFFNSNYKVDNLAILNGDLNYHDFSLSEEFSTGLHGMNILADSINKNHSRVNISLQSGLKPYGNMAIKLSIDPNDSSYFDLGYNLKNIPVSMFNPYTVTYTSFPLDRGTLEINGAWHVLGGSIKSNNHLVITDPRATKRIRGKDKKWIPLPLIFAFIRERGDVIDYEIPINGDMKNPKFHFHDVISDLLKNIFVKPATTPYRFEVKNTEQIIEKSLMIKWPLMGSTLLPNQEKMISALAVFLSENKNAVITIEPFEYAAKEKEYLAFFEAKKKFFMAVNHKNAESLSSDDSSAISKLSIRDHDFVTYLNKQVKDPLLFTLQDKCMQLVGIKKITEALKRIDNNRQQTFDSYFQRVAVTSQVKKKALRNTIPFDGFSYYDIDYNGILPGKLADAYRKMNELNREDPRKKYLKEHKKSLP